MRWRSSSGNTSATSCPIISASGDASANPSLAIFPLTITGNHPPGTKIWLTAQWLNRRGKTRPLATPKSIRLTFDSPVFAAQVTGEGKMMFDDTIPARTKLVGGVMGE